MSTSRQESESVATSKAAAVPGAAEEAGDFEATMAPLMPSAALMRAAQLTPGEVEKLVAEMEELKRANVGLESEKMRNEAVIADLEEANRQNEEFIKVLEGERERYRAEVSSLKEDRAGWMSQLWVLKKTYNDYTQTIEAYERCCENQAAEIESLKSKLAELGCAGDALGNDSGLSEGEKDGQPKQPTEPLPIIGGVVEPLAIADGEQPVALASDSGSGNTAGADVAGDLGAKPAVGDSQPLDLLDSEKLHEALEASAFFEDHEQPPSFSMPKGRLTR